MDAGPPLRRAAATRAALRRALGVYFTLLAVIGAASIGAAIVGGESPHQIVALQGAAGLVLSGVVAVICFMHRRRIRPALSRMASWRWCLGAGALSLVTIAVAYGSVQGLRRVLALPEGGLMGPFIEGGYAWWVPVLLICVQPAIFEELAFRGVIASSLDRGLGARDGLWVTAFLFAFLHLSPLVFAHLIVLGLALGWLRRASGSLYPCMILHFGHNLLATLLEYGA